MDIQVGDKITYENSMGKIRQVIIKDEEQKIKYLNNTNTHYNKILKIERPKYEVVEEKKELLTEEEREFLKDICKYYEVIEIRLNNIEIRIIDNNYLVSCFIYPHNMKFENLERGKRYDLEELGLEEN